MGKGRARSSTCGGEAVNKTTIVKTSDLIGSALDWAVAKAEGVADIDLDGYYPSKCWDQGGPLVDKYGIALNGGMNGNDRVVFATLRNVEPDMAFPTACGITNLIAVCRAVAAAHFGGEVEVPAEPDGGAV